MYSTATVNYHIKAPYPQVFRFDAEGVPGRLESPELISVQVQVKDIRQGGLALDFASHGISFEKHVSSIASFSDKENWQTNYDRELKTLLTDKIGAKEVVIFDHTVRTDNEHAPRKPARNVHNDYSPEGAHQRLIDLVGSEAAREIAKGHYAFVNLWRPIQHTIHSTPLGFIHPHSMKHEDWMDIGLVYPDRHGQILGVAASEQHQWFYMSKMTPEDIIIFNVYDNHGRSYLAHSAMDLAEDVDVNLPRKSIESRTLVIF